MPDYQKSGIYDIDSHQTQQLKQQQQQQQKMQRQLTETACKMVVADQVSKYIELYNQWMKRDHEFKGVFFYYYYLYVFLFIEKCQVN